MLTYQDKQDPAYDVIVIGCGASGICAALEAAKRGARCLVLEQLPVPARKILASGNGRCNFSNMKLQAAAYRSADPHFAESLLLDWRPERLRRYMAEMGLLSRVEEDRVYPYSLQAKNVYQILMATLQQSGATLLTGAKVTAVRVKAQVQLGAESRAARFTVATADGRRFTSAAVILAAGGMAAPALGGTGNAYALYTECGHHLLPLRPALVQLVCRGLPKRLSGIRARVSLRAELRPGSFIQERGELLFTDYGLSGICAMNLAAPIGEVLERQSELPLHVDFLPEYGETELIPLLRALQQRESASPALYWASGILPAKLSALLYEERYRDLTAFRGSAPRKLAQADQLCLRDLDTHDFHRLLKQAKDWICPVVGTKGYTFAQVTDGGLDTREFNPYTLESLVQPGLYACGEVLDVCGPCGGYNLHWAFASGCTAGQNAALRRLDLR